MKYRRSFALFPVLMLLIEFLYRDALQIESLSFLGPTMAAVGVGLIIPLMTLKKGLDISPELKARLEAQGISVVSTRDKIFSDLTLVLVIILTGSWMLALYLSSKYPHVIGWGVPVHIYLGIFNYVVAIVLSEIKEKV